MTWISGQVAAIEAELRALCAAAPDLATRQRIERLRQTLRQFKAMVPEAAEGRKPP